MKYTVGKKYNVKARIGELARQNGITLPDYESLEIIIEQADSKEEALEELKATAKLCFDDILNG